MLALHANSEHAWPSTSVLAAYSGCSRSTVGRALRELEGFGLISRQPIFGVLGQTSNLYELNDIQSLATPTPRTKPKLR